jgi:hypothetical protein
MKRGVGSWCMQSRPDAVRGLNRHPHAPTWYEQPSPGEHHNRDLTKRARELYFS